MSFSLPFCLTFKMKNIALQIDVICIIYVNSLAGRSVGGADWCYFCEREDKVGHAGLCRQEGFQGNYNANITNKKFSQGNWWIFFFKKSLNFKKMLIIFKLKSFHVTNVVIISFIKYWTYPSKTSCKCQKRSGKFMFRSGKPFFWFLVGILHK